MLDHGLEGLVVYELVARWADAERDGDREALDALLDDGLIVVGPFGSVTGKEGWLRRHTGDEPVYSLFSWSNIRVRAHADAVVVVVLVEQVGTYLSREPSGLFQGTLVVLRDRLTKRWMIVAMNFTPLREPC
ncbi:nuclear transport factor 2 family protein [Pseudonocardia acaciae]|uniref:nuclear transport factor 2 family protein n=1 Tax=Pseudonocardia acaciae TaxID=551276 RepID=UPI0005647E51|nr:nuclear transport factor 2 family protein [Pseudonocardia acaciae]